MLSTFLLHLQRVPLVARLRSDLSVQELLEIGDALLAAPILIVEIAVDFADSYATLAEFRRRYGEHMVVGAAEIRTRTQLQTAMEADAQFFALPMLDANLLRFARHHQLLCLPHVTTPTEARLAQLEGCPLVSVSQEKLHCFPMTAWPQAATMIVSETVNLESIPIGRATGVAGLRLQQALFPTTAWSHTEIITTARQLRQQWEGKESEH